MGDVISINKKTAVGHKKSGELETAFKKLLDGIEKHEQNEKLNPREQRDISKDFTDVLALIEEMEKPLRPDNGAS